MKKNNLRVWRAGIKATALALLPLMTATLPFSVRGWGANDNTFNPNAVNASALKPGAVNVDDFCGKLVAELVDGEDKDWTKKFDRDNVTQGFDGGGAWGSADDQECANHGYTTDPNVQAKTVTPSSEKCNVKMLSTDGTGPAACKKTSEGIFRCQMHNSQVIPQCLAYKAIESAWEKQIVVLALDVAAVATCTAACYSSAVTFGATEMLCQVAGTLATLRELYAVFEMSSGTVSSIISGIAAAGGGVVTAVQFSKGGNEGGFGIGSGPGGGNALGKAETAAKKAEEAAKAAEDAKKRAENLANLAPPDPEDGIEALEAQGTRAENSAKKAEEATKKAEEAKKEAETANKAAENEKSQQEAACKAAITFGVMAGLRGYAASQYKDHHLEKARKAIQDLASTVLTGNPGTAGNQGAGTATGFGGISTAGGVVGGSGYGGSSGSSARGDGQSNDPTGCNGPDGCKLPESLASGATDGGILAQSGLDKLLARPAVDIAAALHKGMSPGQAIQSAVGSTGNGVGGALAALAQAAQENASSLAGKINMGGGGAMYTSGGGGGGSRSGSDANPFANLFGGAGAGAGGARATASEEFGKSRVMDIYHTGTTQNLFEIVSGKVSQVTGRVGAR